MSPLLSFLRELQRTYQLAVVVVHHARKDAGGTRPGQALRGSSELHGWGDSNLYVRRHKQSLTLTTEHRAAPSADPFAVRLTQEGPALALSAPAFPVTHPRGTETGNTRCHRDIQAPLFRRRIGQRRDATRAPSGTCDSRSEKRRAILPQTGRVARPSVLLCWSSPMRQIPGGLGDSVPHLQPIPSTQPPPSFTPIIPPSITVGALRFDVRR